MNKLFRIEQGVRGGDEKSQEVGYVNLRLKGETSVDIVVDVFEGHGDDYRRREEASIKIIVGNAIEWKGTPTELRSLIVESNKYKYV